jgi:Ca2+-binding EF-hand superfamily protein
VIHAVRNTNRTFESKSKHRKKSDLAARRIAVHTKMPRTQLTEEELVLCRKAFASFDRDGSGTISVEELRKTLASMGQNPTDEELFVLIHDVGVRVSCVVWARSQETAVWGHSAV